VRISVVAFAQARELLGFASTTVDCDPGETTGALLKRLVGERAIPTGSWRAALNEEYVGWDSPIGSASELAILPPVSGG
jgi:molybdopterin converting factor small subunit